MTIRILLEPAREMNTITILAESAWGSSWCLDHADQTYYICPQRATPQEGIIILSKDVNASYVRWLKFTREEELDRTVSDLHKDSLGGRPQREFWIEWAASTLEEKEVIFSNLIDLLEDD